MFTPSPKTNASPSALHQAVVANNHALVASLIDQRVNVNGLDASSKTPLHYAAEDPKRLPILELLLKAGAQLLADDKGNTPLHNATIQGELTIIKAILHHYKKLDFTMRNRKQQTVIGIAVEKSFSVPLKLFLSCSVANIDLDEIVQVSNDLNQESTIRYAALLCIGQFVYQLECSNDPSVNRNYKQSTLTALKQAVFEYIKTLPLEKRIEACRIATTPSLRLGILMNDMRAKIQRLLMQDDSIEIKIKDYASLLQFFSRESTDNVIDFINKFKEYISQNKLAKFIAILPDKVSLFVFLHALFSIIIKRNEVEVYRAFLHLFETIYSLATDLPLDDRSAIAEMTLECMERGNKKRTFYMSELVLNSKEIIYHAKMSLILRTGTDNYNAIKSFLISLVESSLRPDDIINLLKMEDVLGCRLATYLALNFARGKQAISQLFQDSLPTIYLTLLHHLLDEKNADPQKVADLLTFDDAHLSIPFAHHLEKVSEIELFLELLKKIPVFSRLLIFSKGAYGETLLQHFLKSPATSIRESCDYLLFKCMEMLHKDVTSFINQKMAAKILDILSLPDTTGKSVAMRLTRTKESTYYSISASTLFLQILNVIVSDYHELIPKVIAILLDKKDTIIGRNILSSDDVDRPMEVYMSILENIEKQGYEEEMHQILFDHEPDVNNHFLIAFVNAQTSAKWIPTVDNTVKMFNLFERHIAKIGSRKQIDSFVGLDIKAFLNALASGVISKKYIHSKKQSVAYLDFLETMYSSFRDKIILEYFFNYCETTGFSKFPNSMFRSDQLTYEVACLYGFLGQDQYQFHGQQRQVLQYIKTLPESEKNQVIKNITTPRHPLNIYFNLETHFVRDLLGPEILEMQIFDFLNTEPKVPEEMLLQSLKNTKIQPNDLIELLSRVDQHGKHLAFYLTPQVLNTYFELLSSLLDKKACPFKVTRLLNLQDDQGRTIGHFSASCESFFAMVNKILQLDCRVHILSALLSTQRLIVIGPINVVLRSLQLLPLNLEEKDSGTAKDILKIFTSAEDLNRDFLSYDTSIFQFMKIIDAIVTNCGALVPQVVEFLLRKNVLSQLNCISVRHIRLLLKILAAIQPKIDGEQFVLLLSHCYQDCRINSHFLANIFDTNEIDLTIKTVTLLEAHVRKIGLKCFLETFPISVYENLFQFLSTLQNFAVGAINHDLFVACLRFYEILHPRNQVILTSSERSKLEVNIYTFISCARDVIAAPDLAYYLASSGRLKDFSTSEPQKRIILDHIKGFPIDERITIYKGIIEEFDVLFEFFQKSNNSMLTEIQVLLRRDLSSKEGHSVTNFYAERNEINIGVEINQTNTLIIN